MPSQRPPPHRDQAKTQTKNPLLPPPSRLPPHQDQVYTHDILYIVGSLLRHLVPWLLRHLRWLWLLLLGLLPPSSSPARMPWSGRPLSFRLFAVPVSWSLWKVSRSVGDMPKRQ
jgi:hypothetical protein